MPLTKVSLLDDPLAMSYAANVAGNVSVTRSLAVGYTDGRVPQSNLDVKGNTYIAGATTIAAEARAGTGTGAKDQLILQGVDGNTLPNGIIEWWGSNGSAGIKWGQYTNHVSGSDFILGVAAASGSYASVMEAQTSKAVEFKGAVSGDTVGGAFLATKAEMEAASATDHIVSPGLMNDHPGMMKCWLSFNQVTPAILAEHNTSSVTDSATGRSTTVWDVDFSAATYATGGTANAKVANHGVELIDTTKATTGCGYACKNFATNTDGDTTDLNIWAAGDQ